MLSIVIINYNTAGLTGDCIDSIYRYTADVPFEIIVVDNASPTEDPAILKERFPQINLIRAPKNGGFAYGNNLGIDAAKGSHILLLNSDTYLQDNALRATYDWYLQQNTEGPCSLKLTYADGGYQHCARRFRSISRELLDIARPLLWLLPYRKRATLMLNQHFEGDFDTLCDWVSGAFMMFPRTVLDRLPGRKLDDRFFMYGEDQLWCWQLQKLGAPAIFYSGASLVHIAGGSADPAKVRQLQKTMQDRELVIMAMRKGKGLYYGVFRIIFLGKENLRDAIKWVARKVFGKTIR